MNALDEIREIDRLSTLRYIAEASEGRPTSYCMPNARTLLKHGLIEKRRMPRNRARYFVTEAGRAELAKALDK